MGHIHKALVGEREYLLSEYSLSGASVAVADYIYSVRRLSFDSDAGRRVDAFNSDIAVNG